MMLKRGPEVLQLFSEEEKQKVQKGDPEDVFKHILTDMSGHVFRGTLDKLHVLSNMYCTVYKWKDFCKKDILVPYLQDECDALMYDYALYLLECRKVMTRALLVSPLRGFRDLRRKIMVEYVCGMNKNELRQTSKTIGFILGAVRKDGILN